jgi:hypothetical protein
VSLTALLAAQAYLVSHERLHTTHVPSSDNPMTDTGV